MAIYLIGDIQGCDASLQQLLNHIEFSPSRDFLYLLGDLVNRGPDNAATLRRLMALDGSARCLLGNHDLHLLAVSQGVRPLNEHDSLRDVLEAPDRDRLLHWLRHQSLALQAGPVLMVHAGVLPQWDAAQTLALAGEVESVLQSPDWVRFMPKMYGSEPHHWSEDWDDADRWRVVVNALTRLRFCDDQGHMNFKIKENASQVALPWMPWFDVPQRRTRDVLMAFGHWSTLRIDPRPDVVCLDDGCVWGGCLSALKLPHLNVESWVGLERLSVRCPQVREPTA